MNTRNLKWLRLRNWAAFAVLVPVAFVTCLVLSPFLGIFVAFQIVDENMRGGLR